MFNNRFDPGEALNSGYTIEAIADSYFDITYTVSLTINPPEPEILPVHDIDDSDMLYQCNQWNLQGIILAADNALPTSSDYDLKRCEKQ